MTGGLYLWKDGREVPDTMSVSMEHEEEMLFTWDSGSATTISASPRTCWATDGTISHSQQSISYVPQKVNRPDGNEMPGATRTDPQGPHAELPRFASAAAQPANCPFDLGFRVAIACRMAVESYRQQRTVRWDAAKEEIV